MGSQERQYELILLGATGYTGKLTAEHITTHCPTNLKWAIAGRSASKLEAVAKELRALNPERIVPDIEIASHDPESLSALMRKTRVLITTVGPYAKLGEPVVAACVKNGTHYVDCTGEVPWVKEMIEKYGDEAKTNGAIIMPQCGIESVPADIGTWAVVTRIRKELSKDTKEVVMSIQEMNAKPSGGTLASLFNVLDTYSLKKLSESSKPWTLSPVEGAKYGRSESMLGLRTVPGLGTLTTSIAASIDRAVVHRSWGLLEGGKYYGPNFHFSEYMKVRNAFIGVAISLMYGVGALALLFPPTRWVAKKMVTAAGDGPARDTFTKQRVTYKAAGIADDSPSSPKVFATMTYGGSMYYLTGVFIAEAAMTILRDDTTAMKLGGGFLTPATLGQPFIDRLAKANFSLTTEVVDH